MENKQLKEHDINKIYFVPGNLVTIKHDLPNKPIMLITEVVTSKVITPNPSFDPSFWGGVNATANSKNVFKGVRCIWFTDKSELQEKIFSTKDLIKVEEGE